MTRRDELRMKLELLIGDFNECGLSDDEIYAIAVQVETLVYSSIDIRLTYYKEIQKVGMRISKMLKDRADAIMNSMDISDEEKKRIRDDVERKIASKRKIGN
ncbi:MAG: hypothetical protein ACXACY_22650 [Candidatus Hodarchaeales archaeon]